jgi:tetratricopeptide (TPR) repeat protein
MQAVVDILPKRVLFRDNLSLYASYAGDFARAEKEARAVEEPDAYALLALGFAQLGQRQFPQAAETYRRLTAMNERGASLGASALGDLAASQGHFSDAVRILAEGVNRDLTATRPDGAAAKLIAIAHAEQSRGRRGAALDAAQQATTHSQAVKIRFMAARTFIEAGDVERARPIIAQLSTQPQLEPRAYAKILEGNILRQSGKARQAITVLQEANTLLNTWIGQFDLGRAQLEDGSLIAADSAFDRCIKRSGEALSLFLDEEPTFAYFPAAYYYQGRIRQQLKTEGFADAYRTYLGIRGQSKEDPLVKEARAQVTP